MSRINPFKAYRYNLPATRLKRAVCPPYDIIGCDLEKRLRKNPSNAVQIELPAGTGDGKYGNAAKIWGKWKKQDVVVQDVRPAFYVYEQVFRVGGRRLSRKGFFCEVKIEKPGTGSVLRHELTLSKPKEDRLKLLRALRVNTSPIFGLFKDHGRQVGKIMRRVSGAKPLVQITDREGVIHRLWPCGNSKEQGAIEIVLRRSPILIADGHHRYETSWNYRQEMRGSGGAGAMLFFICPMDDPGLVIFPTHRIVRERKTMDFEDLVLKIRSLGEIFEMVPLSSTARLPKRISFAVTDGRKTFGVRVKSSVNLTKKLSGKPKAYQNLPLVHLHSIVLPEMKKEDFIYVYETKEAVSLARKNKTIAILLPPTSTKELYDVVRAGEVMPQKSTYFYPKIITGLVFRSLD